MVFSTLDLTASVSLVVLGSVLNGAGSSSFFPANTSAVMANAPQHSFGISAGLLRTMSNLGMVCSFAVALFFAWIFPVPRAVAFQIFLGVGSMNNNLASSFIDGMHSAFLASIVLLIVALFLSVLRGKEARTIKRESE